MSLRLLPVAAAVLVVNMAVASEFERQHEAHEHGHAVMTVALDGKVLEIELDSPAANLVGFEHRVRTEAEEKHVHEVLHKLKQGYDVIKLPESALCLLDKVEVKQSLLEDEHEGHDDHAKHDDHDDHGKHDDHDDHGKHDDHDDHGKHDDHDDHAKHDHHEEGHEGHNHEAGESHSDISVHYSYRCVKPDALKSIEIGLFKSFPALEELDVQWVAPSGQGAAELTPATNQFTF